MGSEVKRRTRRNGKCKGPQLRGQMIIRHTQLHGANSDEILTRILKERKNKNTNNPYTQNKNLLTEKYIKL